MSSKSHQNIIPSGRLHVFLHGWMDVGLMNNNHFVWIHQNWFA